MTEDWIEDRPNKAKIRKIKLDLIRQIEKQEDLGMITLPGAQAVLEKIVISEGIFSPENVVSIQKINDPNQQGILFTLKEMVKNLPSSCKIYPGTFQEFAQKGVIAGRQSISDKFLRILGEERVFRRNDALKTFLYTKIAVMDLDFCGHWTLNQSTAFGEMLNHIELAKDGAWVFITHRKGRELDPDRKELQKLFGIHYKDFDKIRESAIPWHYELMAKNNGFRLKWAKAPYEYKDSGNAMIQYFGYLNHL